MLDHGLMQGLGLSAILALAACVAEGQGSAIDYSAWERYREGVQHPCAAIKPQDLERARRNIERYEWARKYAEGVQRGADDLVAAVDAAWLATFIER
ncbi:MAG: hypothetical protein FJX75_25230, partial [Armatimonadetes bacterium]|nr:hypothetical protein [Armatimonadota bacterium]